MSLLDIQCLVKAIKNQALEHVPISILCDKVDILVDVANLTSTLCTALTKGECYADLVNDIENLLKNI